MPQKRVFLMLSGLSPQIVTETLYAFYVTDGIDDTPPSEVHLVTTREGAERARLSLLTGPDAHFHRLVASYEIANLHFSPDAIHIITDESGTPLDDIRTPAQNSAAADYICNLMQRFTQDEQVQLHVSLAGGRKTMGFYAGYALSLFGRPQDTLSHVLISSHFESHPQFFFPTRESRVIHTRDGRPLDTSEATVTLARIPFVRLRHELPQDSLMQKTTFSTAVKMINAAQEPAELRLDLHCKRLSCSGITLRLERMDFLFYLWFVERLLNGRPPVTRPFEGEPDLEYGQELLAIIDRLGETYHITDRTLSALENGMDETFFQSKKARVNKMLRLQLGKSLSEHYQIKTFGKRGHSAFGLALKQQDVVVKGGSL